MGCMYSSPLDEPVLRSVPGPSAACGTFCGMEGLLDGQDLGAWSPVLKGQWAELGAPWAAPLVAGTWLTLCTAGPFDTSFIGYIFFLRRALEWRLGRPCLPAAALPGRDPGLELLEGNRAEWLRVWALGCVGGFWF